MDLQKPIVLIGTGRSGSTLLTRMLDAHPAIDFKGETDFLLPCLWLDVWHDRFWLNWPRQMSADARSAHAPLPEWGDDDLETERQRAALLVLDLFTKLLRIDPVHHQRWGYKELWNGSPSFRFDWEHYDCVIPRAYWLHLIRHPFDFAGSCARWNEQPLTLGFLRDRLKEWVSMLDHNAERQRTGRYTQVRYEDLVEQPREVLSTALNAAGLDWHDACAGPAGCRTFHAKHEQSRGAELRGQALTELVDQVDGLSRRMADLDYPLPPAVQLEDEDASAAERRAPDLRDPENLAFGMQRPRSTTEMARRKQLDDGYRMARTIDSRPWLHGSTKELSTKLTKLLLSMLRGGDPS